MGDVTANYALRYPYNDEVINSSNVQNLADDIAAVLTSTLDADRTRSLGRLSARWNRSATQSVAANAETALIGASEQFDTDNAIDIPTQPTRITVPTGMGGIFWVMALIDTINGTAWSSGQLAIAKNGTDIARRKYWCATGGMPTDMQISTMVQLVPGDFLTCTLLFQGTPNPSTVQTISLSAQRMTT